MAFSIRMIPEFVPGSKLGDAAQYGEIELGEYRETFVALIGFWSPHDYQTHWKASLDRVLLRQWSCLITSLHDPTATEVLHWWLLYPQGSVVAVQNRLLLLNDLPRPFDPTHPYSFVPERQVKNSDGYEISEWQVGLSDIRQFRDTLV